MRDPSKLFVPMIKDIGMTGYDVKQTLGIQEQFFPELIGDVRLHLEVYLEVPKCPNHRYRDFYSTKHPVESLFDDVQIHFRLHPHVSC